MMNCILIYSYIMMMFVIVMYTYLQFLLHLIIVLLLVLQNHGRGGGADLQDDQGHPAHSQRWICFDNETEAEPSSQNLTVPVGTVDIPYIHLLRKQFPSFIIQCLSIFIIGSLDGISLEFCKLLWFTGRTGPNSQKKLEFTWAFHNIY